MGTRPRERLGRQPELVAKARGKVSPPPALDDLLQLAVQILVPAPTWNRPGRGDTLDGAMLAIRFI